MVLVGWRAEVGGLLVMAGQPGLAVLKSGAFRPNGALAML